MEPNESPGAAPPVQGGTLTQDERTWALLAHLSALIGFAIPFGNVIAPLVIWLVKRDQSAFVADQAREALNFNITVLIGALICFVLAFVFIGILLGIALAVYWIVMLIVAGLRANEGVQYRYPFSLRLVR